MLKHYKNAKFLRDNECIHGDILVEDGRITKIGKVNPSKDADIIDLHGSVVMSSFKNYACDVRGFSSSKIEDLIIQNIASGVTDLILITDDLIFGKYILDKHKLNWRIATSNLETLKDIEIEKEKVLLYVDPVNDEEQFLDDISDLAGREGYKVYINLFDNLLATGELNSRSGKLPIHYIESFGLLDRGGYLSGAICSDKEDYRLLSEYDFEVVSRPISDLRKGNGLANVVQIMNAGLELSVGSGDEERIDFFQNSRALLLGIRGLLGDAESISEDEVLEILQRNRLEEGENADFIVLKSCFDSVYNVVNYATRQDVLMTIKNGEIIYIGDEKNAN